MSGCSPAAKTSLSIRNGEIIMNKQEKTVAIALETLGACIVTAGIAVEVATGAAIGHTIISSGCLVVIIGAMLFTKIFREAK